MFDVLVLSRDENFNQKNLEKLQFRAETQLIKEYEVGRINTVKFGDLEGDGRSDRKIVITSCKSENPYDERSNI